MIDCNTTFVHESVIVLVKDDVIFSPCLDFL